ncbi:methyl-accepting chemotaxis protein [Paraburkholderia sp. ZP32-5]|uniref:methyl-accepting chemotaxis protein n=1 Tax=Paraburkholderia sp. ZP32-5 TaxID=2883245 RepID=UPI002DD44336|nr:methyl-accepting chemotaxis protein [Paraburkholderia sp. ZP32-5]
MQERRADLRNVLEMAISIARGLDREVQAGKLDVAAARREAIARISDLRYEGNGYISIVGADSVMIMHPTNPALDGKDMSTWKDARGFALYKNGQIASASSENGVYLEYWWPKPGETVPSEKLGFLKRYRPWGWDFTAGAYEDDIHAAFYSTLGRSLTALLLLGAIMTLLAMAASRSVLRALGADPASLSAVAARIATGDLTEVQDAHRAPEGSVLALMGKMQRNLVILIGAVRGVADGITVGAREIASGNANLSVRTEQQAASLQQTAASMEELTSTVRHNAENTQQASVLSTSASAIARRGNEMVEQVVSTISDLRDSSARIADITGIIEGIAFQTNILALNAAVEAARAGEQGRGFAVVASEVRNLAQRSSVAAKEIKELIVASVQKVSDGSRLADDAGATMSEVTRAVARVNDIIGEIAAASSEQSRGIEQIGVAVTHMDEMTQQNAALVEEAAAASKVLEEQGNHLAEAVSAFRTARDVEDTIATISAAPMVSVLRLRRT